MVCLRVLRASCSRQTTVGIIYHFYSHSDRWIIVSHWMVSLLAFVFLFFKYLLWNFSNICKSRENSIMQLISPTLSFNNFQYIAHYFLYAPIYLSLLLPLLRLFWSISQTTGMAYFSFSCTMYCECAGDCVFVIFFR